MMNSLLNKILVKLTPRFIRKIYQKFDNINGKYNVIDSKLDAFNIKLDSINGKYSVIDSKLNNTHDILSYSKDISSIPSCKGILKDIQNISLILLKNFDKICKRNNIEYWLQGGCLLGAYRQNRFIPWDDDIDVGIMRKSLDKLFNILIDDPLFELKYFYHMSWEYPCRMAKFVVKNELYFWIDVFSYDYLNINEKDEDVVWNNFIKQRLCLGDELRNLNQTYDFVPIYDDMDRKKAEQIFKKYINKFCIVEHGNYVIFGIDNILSNYKRLFPYNMIFPLNKLKFENNVYPVPNKYESYIYRQYGNPFIFPKYIDRHFDISNNYDNLKTSIDRIYKKLESI